MNQALADLINILSLKKSDDFHYEGQPVDLGLRQLYGGALFAQAISAAIQFHQSTYDIEKSLHYATASFLNAGDVVNPVVYKIKPLKVGKSFTVLSISAWQNNALLMTMQASMHCHEEGFYHQQTQMPSLPLPDTLISEYELAQQLANFIPAPIRKQWLTPPAFDIHPVKPLNPFLGEKSEANHQAWFKLTSTLEDPTQALVYALIAYHSDHNFLPSTLRPHNKGFLEKDMQVATLNHSIWYHQPININQWFAYIMQSPIATQSLGLVKGEIFDSNGLLIATTQQEGLIRQHG